MTENNAQEAKDLADKAGEQAKQAGSQAKAAAKTGGRALRTAAEPVAASATEEARDTAEKLEGTVQDAARTARKVRPKMLNAMLSDTGIGLFALSMAIYSSAIAYDRLRQAASGRSQVIS